MLDLMVGLSEKRFAGRGVLPLMHGGVLRRNVKITQTPLKRRGIVYGSAASQGEARVDYTNTTGGNPYSGLRTLDEERDVLERPGERALPMASDLDLKKRPGGAKFSRDTPEFKLECLRIAHRPSGPLLLVSAASQFD
jgi:hypothetical protein